MYGLLGSLVPVTPTKELIETTLMARKSRSVHALILSLHKHTQRYYLSDFQVGVYPAIANVKWKQRWAFTIHSVEV
jgi:hypothetical protein